MTEAPRPVLVTTARRPGGVVAVGQTRRRAHAFPGQGCRGIAPERVADDQLAERLRSAGGGRASDVAACQR